YFYHDSHTTYIYTLSLHDALPISDLEDLDTIKHVFNEHKPEIVINLAAQAGVRYSLENPHAYIDSNIVGFTNVLEACRHFKVERSEEHTSELQSRFDLVCRLLLEK